MHANASPRMSRYESAEESCRDMEKLIIKHVSSSLRFLNASSLSHRRSGRLLLRLAMATPAPTQHVAVAEMSSSISAGGSSRESLFVISNGYQHMFKSCILISPTQRYLINCGDGIQRLFEQHGLKPNKVTNVLLTRFDWQCAAGLSGLTLEMDAKMAKHTTHIHSPMPLAHFSGLNEFMFDKSFAYTSHDYDKNNSLFEDEWTTIRRVAMKRRANSYLFELKLPRGNLDMAKVKALTSKKPGPWLAQLALGNDCTTPGGVHIRADDVLDNSSRDKSARKILFLDCDADETEAVFAHPLINQPDMFTIVHMASSGVLNSPAYMHWMRSYANAECLHVTLDELDGVNVDMPGVYECQARLNHANGDLFPLLAAQRAAFRRALAKCRHDEAARQREMRLLQGHTGMQLELRPEVKLTRPMMHNYVDVRPSLISAFNYYSQDTRARANFTPADEKLLASLKRKFDDLEPPRYEQYKAESADKDDAGTGTLSVADAKADEVRTEMGACWSDTSDYPKVVFLGTSSSTPTITRGLSAILVKVNATSSMLLDCGEGTVGQLGRLVGCAGHSAHDIDEELMRITGVFISHHHLDHFNGLVTLIKSRQRAFERHARPHHKLYVLFPRTLQNFPYFMQRMFDVNAIKDLIMVPNESIMADNMFSETTKEIQTMRSTIGVHNLSTVCVKHIKASFGICIETKLAGHKSFRIVYSGDCRPSQTLIKAGKDCDLLIHECTFDNVMIGDAIRKAHSTTAEALQVSRDIRAKWTVLTHMSSRYRSITHISDFEKYPNVAYSFDFMCISPKYLPLLNDITPKLRIMFREVLAKNEFDRELRIAKDARAQSRASNA